LQSVRVLRWPALEDWMVERHFLPSFQARRHMRVPQCSERVWLLSLIANPTDAQSGPSYSPRAG
jgi:hypothetical protein